MKAAALVGFVGSALGGLAHGASTLFPNSPALFWSNERSIFNGQNAYSSAVMDQHDILEALTGVAKRDRNSDDWGIIGEQREAFEPAELLCVFLVPSLTGSELTKFAAKGEQSFVQNAVESADSSVVVPHTTRSGSLRDVLDKAAPIISYDELKAFTAEGGSWNSLLSDGKTDIVVVEIDEGQNWQKIDSDISDAAERLTLATNGLVDFALVADTTKPAKITARQLAEQASTTTAAIVCDAGYLIGYSAAGKAFCFSHYVNMTPEILTALLFGLLFIFLAYVGLSVLHGIQTPLRYPLHGPPRGKEF